MIKRLLDQISEYLKKLHSERIEDQKENAKYTHYNQHPWCPEQMPDQGDQI